MASLSAATQLVRKERGVVFVDDIDRFVERVYSHALLRPLFKHEHGVKGTMAKRLRYYTNDDAVVEVLLQPDTNPYVDMPDDFGGLLDDPNRPVA
mmetsp:Transcript_17159/g.40256  ORF Transcript_17159/g.40256 Transcript_17159/m.40256 type:complete len:95 (+) Transcript_17159:933-1217(+)